MRALARPTPTNFVTNFAESGPFPVGTDQAFTRYRLLLRLGQGGMSEIFLAAFQAAPQVHRVVVLKRLLALDIEGEDGRQMFLDEARIALRLSHPNIVQTHDIGLFEGEYCIAMEFLRGQSLQRVMRRSQELGERLPLELCVRIAIDALEGLSYAHEAVDYDGEPLNVVHRDVSPHNIFVPYDGRVKVLDFGIAQASTQEGKTSTGLVKGKFAYMAPEQARADDVDARSDVWSVGVVLWELITGLRLFRAATDAATLQRTLSAPVPLPSERRPGVPAELDALIRRALERLPSRRFESARAMKESLETWLAGRAQRFEPALIQAFMNACFAEEKAEQERCIRDLLARPDDAPPVSATALRRSAGLAATSSLTSMSAETSAETTELATQLYRQQRVQRVQQVLISILLVFSAAALSLLAYLIWMPRPPLSQAAAAVTGRTAAEVAPVTGSLALAFPDGEAAPPSARQLATASIVNGPAPAVSAAPVSAAPVSAAPVSAVPVVPPAPSSRRSASNSSQRAERAVANRDRYALQKQAGVAPLATGLLTLDSAPWAIVSRGGKVLGQTPLVKFELPVGEHVLLLTNPELGLRTRYTIRIEAGKTTVRRVGLD